MEHILKMSSELYCDLFIAPRMMLPGDALFMVVSFRVCVLWMVLLLSRAEAKEIPYASPWVKRAFFVFVYSVFFYCLYCCICLHISCISFPCQDVFVYSRNFSLNEKIFAVIV